MATRLTSKNTTLEYETAVANTWAVIPDVKKFPKLMGDVQKVDTSCVSGDKTYGEGQADPGDMDFLLAYTGQAAGSNFAMLTACADGTPHNFRERYPDNSGYTWSATVRLTDEGFDGGDAAIEFHAIMFPTSNIVPTATIAAIGA